MTKVICHSIGKCDECPNCGARHPHDCCEPCPFVPEAKCIPIPDFNPEDIIEDLIKKK